MIIKAAVLKLARYMREYAPTYLYTFNFKGRKTKLGYGKPVEHTYLNGNVKLFFTLSFIRGRILIKNTISFRGCSLRRTSLLISGLSWSFTDQRRRKNCGSYVRFMGQLCHQWKVWILNFYYEIIIVPR